MAMQQFGRPTFTGGYLLVASPEMTDPNFARTVVLMLDHSADGAFGVVLNRPAPTAVLAETDGAVGAILAKCSHPNVVFLGGPVLTDGILCLVRPTPGSDFPGLCALPNGHLHLETHQLDLSAWDAESADGIAELRLFAGHSGWGSGQLDGELLGESWFVVRAEPSDVFTPEPEGLWADVLARQSGSISRLAYVPQEPWMN